jgi:hypothetical protein
VEQKWNKSWKKWSIVGSDSQKSDLNVSFIVYRVQKHWSAQNPARAQVSSSKFFNLFEFEILQSSSLSLKLLRISVQKILFKTIGTGSGGSNFWGYLTGTKTLYVCFLCPLKVHIFYEIVVLNRKNSYRVNIHHLLVPNVHHAYSWFEQYYIDIAKWIKPFFKFCLTELSFSGSGGSKCGC